MLDGGRRRSSRRRRREESSRRPRQRRARPRAEVHERVDTVVRGEQVGAETDDEDVEALVAREAQRFTELRDRAGSCERTRRTTDADASSASRARRRARRCVTTGSPSTTARAIRHGSPTPSVTITSPDRAQASVSAAASSSVGAHPLRVGGGTRSRTSFPVTPVSGASRPPITSVTTAASAIPSAWPSS